MEQLLIEYFNLVIEVYENESDGNSSVENLHDLTKVRIIKI